MTGVWRITVMGAGAGAGIAAAAFTFGQLASPPGRSWWLPSFGVAVGIGSLGGWLVGRWVAGRVTPLIVAASALAEGRRPRVSGEEGLPAPEEIERLSAALRNAAEGMDRRGAAIVEDRTRFDAILSGMVEGVLVLDRAGRILLLNPAMERMLGDAARGSVGRHWLDIVRQHELNELIRAVILHAEPRAAAITIDDAAGARTFAVQGSVARRPNGGDNDLRAVFVFHDVSALKRLERVRSDFIANVSHELRTPLTAIIGYVEALLDAPPAGVDASQQESFLRTIKTHADRLGALVQDLLELSQIESGDYRWRRESVDIVDLVRRTADLIDPLARRRGVAVRWASDAPTVWIVADDEKLTQVMVNLLDNAVKYTESGGAVEVSVTASEKQVEIRVRDTGIGIPPADRERVFERFYRVDRARSRESGGTGLGLSIVKHVVDAHGGTVRVDSQLGQGSTFTVTLPRNREPNAA